MALKLGGTFMTCALGPVSYAGTCIQASRMPEGIQELGPEGLLGGFWRGIEQAAKLAGVRVADVEELLPVAEVRDHIEQLSVSHRAALETWSLYAGRIGGLLHGVTELTVDGRAPDASLCLQRLATKVQRDPPFAEPLQALADDVAHWQELIVKCRGLLDESGEGRLAKASRRRKIRNALTVGIPILLVLSALVVLLFIRAARKRVDVSLASEDVCAVRGISDEDFARGSSAQQQLVVERRTACIERQLGETREREGRERAATLALDAQRQHAQREAKCQALADRVKAGTLAPEDEASAGSGSELLRRIAQRKLLASDVGPHDPLLPCDGARGSDELLEALADALVASVWIWVPAGDPSGKVAEVLASRRGELPERARMMLAVRAADAAKRALAMGSTETMGRASRLCALSAALGFASGVSCNGILGIERKAAPGASL